MKTVLIRPPATYPRGAVSPSANTPVGLLWIAAVLEEHGFPVAVIDGMIDPDRPARPVEGGGLHFGMGWEEMARRVTAEKPRVVGISAPFSAQFANSLRCAALVKDLFPEALVVMGGNHPTIRPGDCFSGTGAIDLVCLGEGEEVMLEIVRRRARGESTDDIPGTAIRDGNSFRRNGSGQPIADLDSLPLPAYHLIELECYFRLHRQGYTDRTAYRYPGSERTVSVVTSRGCPFDCVFCSIHLHMGRKWRSHSADYVRRHIDLLASRYGVRHIHFEDDNISASPVRFRRILEDLKGGHPGITWDTPNGIRVDTLDEGIVGLCKESGCTYLIFGVESGCQRVLDEVVGKRLNLAAVTEAARWCGKAELNAMAFYVIGFPGESIDEMRATADFAMGLMRSYDVQPFLFVATPLPGTRLEKICLDRGFLRRPLEPEELARMTQGNLCVETDEFTFGDVSRIARELTREVGRTFKWNAARFFLRHPGAFPRFLREAAWLSRQLPRMESAHRILEFKMCLIRTT
ncbi:MAG: B12-binding domain-containing radical SAM protein [Deltaproteobacteria bacterium]|nr:B12-binding domain-containing radical SAM protein [Deltaproteobacteria bacterium]